MDAGVRRILADAMRREGWRDGRAETINRPSDRGGLTRGGVTAMNWGAYLGLARPATREELERMTYGEALEFYHEWYVVRPGFEAVADGPLRALLVDWAFTSWFDDPVKALQVSLRARGLYAGAVDGHLGPKTRAALAADADPERTYYDVLVARGRFYRNLAFDGDVLLFLDEHPRTQLHNLGGWLNRTLEFVDRRKVG